MTAEQDGFDLAKVKAEHAGHHVVDGHCCSCNGHHATHSGPCLPYRLAALALDLQGELALWKPKKPTCRHCGERVVSSSEHLVSGPRWTCAGLAEQPERDPYARSADV